MTWHANTIFLKNDRKGKGVLPYTAQKMKFLIKDFFSKCDHIRSFLRIWSYLLKKSLMENFIFLYSGCYNWKIHDIRNWLPFETCHLTSLVLGMIILFYTYPIYCVYTFLFQHASCQHLYFPISWFLLDFLLDVLVRWILEGKKNKKKTILFCLHFFP